MALIRSLLFFLLFYPGTLVYVLTVIAVSPFGSAPVRKTVHGWSAFHYWLVRHILRIRFEWDGEIPEGAYLIAVKHLAMVEAVDTLRFARTPVVVMKSELTTMPLFGWVTLRYGSIGVDRDAGGAPRNDGHGLGGRGGGAPGSEPPKARACHLAKKPPQPGFAGPTALGLPVPIAHDSGKIWPRGCHNPARSTSRWERSSRPG
jgi:1-acyl-sn-glycerol-3-phosphate acyltransferase